LKDCLWSSPFGFPLMVMDNEDVVHGEGEV